ncbi:PDDEXK nuclease domain-containing protein [Prosthecobacter sp.]|uniref:PDDEXK nuclease domain-containing protein n=1 Tax=Prosthecobacter sp. TaxID=1965333 RepID=UPI002487F93A|nr:PDDEXK nuclease domain-containing protein [Prosthecobacter sp.]MDI1312629.1 PDDEXK nuclease domain-containing protein [Prosthecobacter sp.]
MSTELTHYKDLLGDIKIRVRQAQHKAALSANAEMIRMYWEIGCMIAARQKREGWGAGVIPRLAMDLKNELPEEKGFSERNIGYMIRFAREYGAPPILQQPAAKIVQQSTAQLQSVDFETIELLQQPAAPFALPLKVILGLPWFHHVILIQKIKDLPTRLWYARQTMELGWSRDTLTTQIKNCAHERQGGAVTNFATTLPEVHASLAQGLLKDPYLFDFLTLEEPFHERELETGLLGHIQKFLIELGRGFAFVGRQYRLAVSDREFYLDLLFYHLQLRCFVVVDLKKGDFKPEHAGKMNFYCSVVDDQLRHLGDAPTIGLILCQTKDRILAEYSLRDIQKPIGVADYELTRALPAELASSLPSIEALEAEFSADLAREDPS